MPEDTEESNVQPPKSKLPLIIGGGVVLSLLVAAIVFFTMGGEEEVQQTLPPAEYIVSDEMYQLKDGAYLRLGFSIVVPSDKVEVLKEIIEREAPGRLPDGVNMVVANKSREDLISGTHKRQAFARELKKMLEERVVASYNSRQLSAEDTIRIEEVLISVFVTQGGT